MGFFESVAEVLTLGLYQRDDSGPAPAPAAETTTPIPLPPAPNQESANAAAQEQQTVDKRKRAQTLLTGARGDTSTAPVGKKKLLGE